MVEIVKRVLTRLGYNYDEQANLVTYCKWPPPLQNTPLSPPSLREHLIWKVKKIHETEG